MSTISASAITTDAEFEKQIAGASFEEIKSLMAQRAVEMHLVNRDQYDPSVLIPVEPGPQSNGFTKTVTINGTKHIIEGATETELTQAETQLYRAAVNQPAAATTQSRDAATGQFTATPTLSAEDRASLDFRFQLGQVSASEYIEQSGAVASYLEKAGVPLDELREQVAEKQAARQTQNGDAVVQEFLNSPAGSSWPGGTENLNTAGRLLVENDLAITVENLAAVFEHMKTTGQVATNPELDQRDRIANAKSSNEIYEALRPGGRDSGLFGR